MDSNNWADLFVAARADETSAPKAVTYRRSWDSSCRAVQVTCDDGSDYVVKGAQAGRSAFNDQVVGRIAMKLGAPVAEVGLVEVDQELIKINPEMSHLAAGLAHGSRFVRGCTQGWIDYVDVPANRPRWALLSLLYGWMVGAEKQFFYSTQPPHLVFSFDHDAFFPNGPDWTIEHLAAARYPEVDDVIVAQSGLTYAELDLAYPYLNQISREIIASAIAVVPESFGAVTEDERIALASYLWERSEVLRS